MKKMLILGGSHRDIPLIKAAQELGLHVITLGHGANYIGHRYANEFIDLNFNKLDEISRIITDMKIDHLCSGCSEQALQNTVMLSERHRIGVFDSLKVTSLIHDKFKFKAFCLANEISVPRGCETVHVEDVFRENLRFPLIVKPLNLSGGNGVTVVKEPDKLGSAVLAAQEASQKSSVLLEEYIEGNLIAYSTFIKNKDVATGFLAHDTTYLNPFLITTAHPIRIPQNALNKLNADVRTLCRKLDLVDGPFHLQVIVRDETPYIIDVTRRIPGDLFPYLIEHSTGVIYCKNVIRAAMGDSISDDDFKSAQSDFIIRHCVMPAADGIYAGLVIDPRIKTKIFHELYLSQVGEEIVNYLRYQIGILFIRSASEQEMHEIVSEINDLIRPIITRGHKP